jgi:hypothetical protein
MERKYLFQGSSFGQPMHATKYQLDCSLHYHWAGRHMIQC